MSEPHGHCIMGAGMSTLPTPYITEEQYLEFDRKADFKSQYIDGQMYAMAGAREAHNQLVFAFAGLAFPAVRSRSCRGYGSEMRVRTPRGMNTYPDLSFVCGEA